MTNIWNFIKKHINGILALFWLSAIADRVIWPNTLIAPTFYNTHLDFAVMGFIVGYHLARELELYR